MLLPYRLPQLAVSAKLFCLLMVVICGAVPSVVHSVKLFSESSNKFVQINDSGQVFAADGSDNYLNLTIISTDFTTLSIYSEQTRRYICFNRRWKLVGMKSQRSHAQTRCQFHEEINGLGYNTYRSIANGSHYLAFNARGKPVRRHPLRGYSKKCTFFMKMGGGLDITAHNERKKKGNPPESAYQKPHKRRHMHSRTRK